MTMQMAREMEIELRQTREAIQKHAEEMINLLLELEVRLEERLTQAQARIDELKNAASSVQANSPKPGSDKESAPTIPDIAKGGGTLFAMAEHHGTNSNNGTNHLNAT